MKKYKIFFFIIVLILIISAVLPIPSFKQSVFNIFSPASKKLNNASEKTTSFLTDLLNVSKLSQENENLKQKNNELNAENVKLKELKTENEALKKELNFQINNSEKQTVVANIISKSPSTYLQTMTIDKGENNGIKKGQVVLSEGYLVGIISEIYLDYSQVELITSPKTIIPIILQESRSIGLLKSNLKGLFIDNVPIDEKISFEEEVLTNNLDKNIPSNIAIGKVNKITNYQSEIFQKIEVVSPVEFSKIKIVTILIN